MNKQSKISPNQKFNSKDNLYTNNKVNLEADYFVSGPNIEIDCATSAKICSEISDVSTGTGCFKGTFSL